ncbi:MAG: hypothetical protein V4654_14720 [Bdellovibrionota bacterium]
MSNAESTPTAPAINVKDTGRSKEDEIELNDEDEIEPAGKIHDRFGGDDDVSLVDAGLDNSQALNLLSEEDEDFNFDAVENILELPENEFPKFTLAKNKARFLRMVSWYRQKEEWIEVAPLSGVQKLFKQQTKELEGIRASKMDYEMELETGTLTPSQRSYKRDELKMCRVQEKMAVHLISKLQLKIKSGRR